MHLRNDILVPFIYDYLKLNFPKTISGQNNLSTKNNKFEISITVLYYLDSIFSFINMRLSYGSNLSLKLSRKTCCHLNYCVNREWCKHVCHCYDAAL